MLVLVSDLHFTDSTVGLNENVPARAFAYLAEDLKGIIENEEDGRRRNEIRDAEVVLLGDVFDLLRSARWEPDGPMPWSEPGPELEERSREILRGVIEQNSGALGQLRGLKQSLGLDPANVRLRYVAGNHDRLVNLFASTRELAREALGLGAGGGEAAVPFPVEYRSGDYSVLARHGNQFDGMNWGGSFDRSGLGDAVVVKLLNGFPANLRTRLDEHDPHQCGILEKIAELDHVRPLWAVPRWVRSVLEGIADESLRAKVREAWTESVAGFLDDPFVRRFTGGFNPFRATWWLPAVLRTPWGAAERFFEWAWARNLLGKNDAKFAKVAADEDALVGSPANGELEFVAYGHTHNAMQVPLDVRGSRRLVYFNTGTWRNTVRPAEHSREGDRDFIPWQVMSYLVLYRQAENRGHRFEMWSGMRGD